MSKPKPNVSLMSYYSCSDKDTRYDQRYNLCPCMHWGSESPFPSCMYEHIICTTNAVSDCLTDVLLISLSTEQFSLPPQLPPRNFTPSESKDCHAEPLKMIEQNRVSIVETYFQRLQIVDMSQYYMIYTIRDLCHVQ